MVFWGDLASGWLHLRPAWTVAYDTHPDETIRMKVEWMERIFANNWIVASYHDWQFALARLRRNERGRMEPVRVG